MLKNFFKSSLTLVITIFIFSLFINTANAKTNTDTTLSFEKYQEYKNQGILGDDIDYETWKDLVLKSRQEDYQLAVSDIFSEIHTFSVVPIDDDFFTLNRGDILVTNGTSFAGITGHSGIAISDYEILHIPGPNHHPEVISLYDWNKTYSYKNPISWTKVYRHKNYNIANKAAKWAKNTYKNSNATYKITAYLETTDTTYCSKLVWQAFRYGPNTPQTELMKYGVITPYSLDDAIFNINYKHKFK